MTDVFNQWAAKSELEKYVLRFMPGTPRSTIAALEWAYKLGHFLYYPVNAYYFCEVRIRPLFARICRGMEN